MNQSKVEANIIYATGVKHIKTCASKTGFVLVFLLIGKESGTSFANQSQSIAKQNQSKHELLLTLNNIENHSKNYVKFFSV